MKRVTLADVAKASKTSLMTVSRVVNNKYGVSEHTKKRVMYYIEKLGYTPNDIARSLKDGKSGRIGVVVSDIRNIFYSLMVGDIEDLCVSKNISVIVSDTGRTLEQERNAVNSLIKSGVDSILIAPEGYESDHLIKVIKNGIKLVSFGVHFENEIINEVWIDEEAGAKQVGEYFKKLGLKKVKLLMGNPKKFTTKGRIKGFIEGYGTFDTDKDLEFFSVNWNSTYKYIRNLEKLPEAIFCYNDMLAMGVLKALNERNIKPGADIKVVGYDDIFLSDVFSLTTVKIPVERMIKDSFQMLIGEKSGKIKYIPKLKLRNSA